MKKCQRKLQAKKTCPKTEVKANWYLTLDKEETVIESISFLAACNHGIDEEGIINIINDTIFQEGNKCTKEGATLKVVQHLVEKHPGIKYLQVNSLKPLRVK